MTRPGFFPRSVLDHLHGVVLRTEGGMFGVRDDAAIKSALARAKQAIASAEPTPDLYSQAVLIGEGIAKAHGYVDGNKRTACSL
jgi:death on curing protein